MKGRPVTFRPHGKAHKSPVIGKLQLASGAKGLCAAKLGEADVLIRGGIKDVLITAEVVGQLKIERLMALLAITPDVKAVVDNEQNVVDLSTAALAAKRKLKVAIDCNVGQNRTGLGTPEEVVALAQVIARQKGLELVGLQGYGGNNQHVEGIRQPPRPGSSVERAGRRRPAGAREGRLHGPDGQRRRHGQLQHRRRLSRRHRDPARVVHVHGHELQQDRRPRHRRVLRVRQFAVGAHDRHQPRDRRPRRSWTPAANRCQPTKRRPSRWT